MNSAHSYSEGAEVPEDRTEIDNLIIAEFMDRWIDMPDGYHAHPYDESWDQLMLVVEKIESMRFSVMVIGKYTLIHCPHPYKEFATDICNTKIQSVYKAVLEYIKWHNECKLESLKNKPI